MNQSRTIQPRDAIASARLAINEAIINRVEPAIHAATDFDTRTATTPFTGYNIFGGGFFVREAIDAAIYAGRR
jgi:hypothetical protein